MITKARELLGKEVTVTIDRPLGSAHPKFPKSIYPINYGFIPDTLSPVDKEEIDAYVIGPTTAVKSFTGIVIAIVKRNDDEEKLVVAQVPMTEKDIEDAIKFQEQYYTHKLTLYASE